MKIMVKASGNDKWQKVDERTFGKEAELQELLSSNPDLIPMELLGDERSRFGFGSARRVFPGPATLI
jgi:hypothetical protein